MESSSIEDNFVLSLLKKKKKKGNIGSIQSWDIERMESSPSLLRSSGIITAIQSLLQDVSGSVWCFASDTRATY